MSMTWLRDIGFTTAGRVKVNTAEFDKALAGITNPQAIFNFLDEFLQTIIGAGVSIDDTNFDNNLVNAGTDVQAIFDFIDDMNLGGLVYFIENRNVTLPNNVKPAHQIIATGAETDIDAIFSPKGSGAIIAQVPDNAVSGGLKRGAYAVDLQTSRTNADQVASHQSSVVAGGGSNKASAQSATVSGGSMNTASALRSTVSGGGSNIASGTQATISGGTLNKASGENSTVTGGYKLNAYLQGQFVGGGQNSTTNKVRQDSKLTLQKSTTDVSPAIMVIDSGILPILPNNMTWAFDITITAAQTAANCARFKRSGLIFRGANAASTTIEGAIDTPSPDIISAGLAGIAIAVAADTANGALQVTVTGLAATTIIWQAKVEIVEIEI